MLILRSPLARLIGFLVVIGVSLFFYFDTQNKVDKTIEDTNKIFQSQDTETGEADDTRRSRSRTTPSDSVIPEDAQEQLECVQEAGTDVKKLQECTP